MSSNESDWKATSRQYKEANFLQSPAYGKMNELLGDKVICEKFGENGRALMIVRNAKRGRYLEIPCGPLVDWKDKKGLKVVFERIKEIARQEKCVFVRIRPQLNMSSENMKLLSELGLVESPMHLAAEHTVIIEMPYNYTC